MSPSNLIFRLLFLATICLNVNAGKLDTLETAREDVNEMFNDLIVPSFFGNLFTDISFEALVAALRPNVNEQCLGHSVEWLYQLWRWRNQSIALDLWALHMIDAFAKLPEGILSGHINPLGDFDECIGIRANNVNFSAPVNSEFPDLPTSFRAQYCTIYLVPTLNLSAPVEVQQSRVSVSIPELIRIMAMGTGLRMAPSVATCFPSTCSITDSGNFTKNFLNLIGIGGLLIPAPLYCTTGEKPDFDAGHYSIISILGVLFALSLFAGLVDMWINRGDKPAKPGPALQYLLTFSLYTNIRKLLNTRSSGDDLGCVHGIRFLSTSWVVLAHTWYMVAFIPNWNMVDVKRVTHTDMSLLTIINGSLAVDTFFVMSGMLVSYNLLKLLNRSKGRLNVPMFYIHRYLRLTPTYAIIIGIMATLLPYIGSGPFWTWQDRWAQVCRDEWWQNLLYVNNFVTTDTRCQSEAWYLAADMQMYIISPLFIYPLWKWGNKGLAGLGLLTVLTTFIPTAQIYLADGDIVPSLIPTRPAGTYYEDVYIKPYSRISVYLAGVILGYILLHTKGRKLQIPKIFILLGWCISTATCLAVLYGTQDFYDPEKEIPEISGTLYGGYARFAWGCSVAWVIFACVKGYGGLVNRLLAWKVFIPLGRVCFCVYLISLHLQMALHLNFKQSITYDHYTLTNFFFAHMVMSFGAGFFCTVTMESPFVALEKLMFEGPVKPRPVPIERPAVRHGIFYEKELTIVNTGDSFSEKKNNNV